jgi:hypothetical protein
MSAKKKLHLTLNADGTVNGTVDGKFHAGTWYISGEDLCIVLRLSILEKTRSIATAIGWSAIIRKASLGFACEPADPFGNANYCWMGLR